MKPIIIGVDTGNRCIKTVHNVFVSGINKQKAKPIQSKEVLKYNDEYYTLTKKRVNYLQDKTENDEYFFRDQEMFRADINDEDYEKYQLRKENE